MVNLNIKKATPQYQRMVRRGQMLDRLDADMALESIKAEIMAMASKLIDIIGVEKYGAIIDEVGPDDASFEIVRDVLLLMVEAMECDCVLPEQSCPACIAAATEGLEEGEIPFEVSHD